MRTQPFIPRKSPMTTKGGIVAHDWDASCFQPLIQAVNALSTTILSGPDADPNGVVIGSPGYLYRRIGAATSALYVKESGVNTDTGWVLK